MKKGDHARSKHSHPAVPKGTHGTVHSVHTGTFYGLAVGGGIAYLPASHVEPVGTSGNPDPDSDGDNDMPVATWQDAMALVIDLAE